VLVVDCDPELQIARLMARDGISRDDARRMLDAQASREARLSVADDVIRNDADVTQLRDQVEKLHRVYLTAASASGRATQSARNAT
jgi:dephospho-CoA kinase